MKPNNLSTFLHTDIGTLLHRICFALCPPRVHWPTEELEDQDSYRSDSFGASSDGFLWGNCVFWTNSPTWGHSAGLEGNSPEAYTPAGPTE